MRDVPIFVVAESYRHAEHFMRHEYWVRSEDKIERELEEAAAAFNILKRKHVAWTYVSSPRVLQGQDRFHIIWVGWVGWVDNRRDFHEILDYVNRGMALDRVTQEMHG